MKYFLLVAGIIAFVDIKSQSLDEIDAKLNYVKNNLESFQKITVVVDSAINEDAHVFDTTYYYCNSKNDLVYINRKTTASYFHIKGDVISFSEVLFINNNVVFFREWGFEFQNPDWDREPNLGNTIISVSESSNEYYKEDGTALISFKRKFIAGEYLNRFILLDSLPREEKLKRRWRQRCDECIEIYFLKNYRCFLDENSR